VNGTPGRAHVAVPNKCTKTWGCRKTASVSSTELCLGEIKDKAAPRVTFWGLDYLDGFLGSPASTVHASVHDRREWTKGSRCRK
jgi:hypothetical protein